MRKAGIQRESITLVLQAEDIATIAEYMSRAGDSARADKEKRVRGLRESIEDSAESIRRREQDIQEYNDSINENEGAILGLEDELAKMPAPRQILAEEVRADMEKASKLPWIKDIRLEKEGTKTYIVATTRENALYTTLARKFSKTERWYRSKPYRIALPAYKIRIGLVPHITRAGNAENLGLALANYKEDTAHWLHNSRYSHEPHPHWGTTSVSSNGDAHTGEYRGVCLGEYEGEITQALARSITEGLVLFATYLQTAGATNAYVSAREKWALYLGKCEYNLALVPSQKEVEKLTEVDDAEDEETPSCSSGDCDDCELEGCECDCHNRD